MPRIHKALPGIPGTTKTKGYQNKQEKVGQSWLLSVLEPGGQPAWAEYRQRRTELEG